MPAKRWPPPGFPLVEGASALAADGSISLLSAGKPSRGMEAPDRGALAAWFETMQMPYDGISSVE